MIIYDYAMISSDTWFTSIFTWLIQYIFYVSRMRDTHEYTILLDRSKSTIKVFV